MSSKFRWLFLALATTLPAAAPPGDAFAQGKKTINLDEEDEGDDDDDDDEKDAGPVVAGQMTEQAAKAKRLFDQERWFDASLILRQVANGETDDDKGNQQIASYHLAICLYRLKFFQASYDRFKTVAENPNHLKFSEALPWLSKLATQLPEPADIIGSLAKYSEQQLKKFDNAQQRELFWQLNYLLGRYKYRNAREFEVKAEEMEGQLDSELTAKVKTARTEAANRYNAAIKLFASVARDSPYFIKAQFFSGISYVSLKKSVPAVKAFTAIVDAIDEGVEGVDDEQRMKDLANLSMARTFYSASVRLNENNVPTIDGKRLSAAVKYWNLVDVSSEYWLDALFEQSWAYFMAGDYPHALGNIHTIQSPYFPNAFYPEADVVRMVIYFTICQYDDATTLVAKFKKRYEPIEKELAAVLKRYEGEGGDEKFFKFLKEVQAGTAKLAPAIKPIVESALGDRQLLRNIEYVRVLDGEIGAFNKAPVAFKNSPVGGDVEDSLKKAKSDAVRRAGGLARARYQRNLDELREKLRDSQKIVVDITNAQRKKIDEEVATGQWTAEDAYEFGQVPADEEHHIWPFNGEYWRDELGFYRQVVYSNCGGPGSPGAAK